MTKRTMIVAALVVAFASSVGATPARAEKEVSCTDQYVACINTASKYDGLFRSLAEFECGVQYTSCLASKLKFW